MLRFSWLGPVVALLAMVFASAPARAESCDVVFDALTKVVSTPHHLYMTEIATYLPGGSRTNETINADGVLYVQIRGKWRKSSVSQKDMAEQQEENRKTNKGACQFVRDEMVNGEMAALYKVQTETEDLKSNGQVWVSKSRHLPLREEDDMDVGGAEGKSHREMRWEYSNVHAPAL